MSSITGMTPNYATFGHEAMLPLNWVFPTASEEKRMMYQWTGNMLEERQHAYKSMKEVQGGRVWWNAQLYKSLTQNFWVGCLVWYFDPRFIPGTSHKLRSFWEGPYRVSRLIAPALMEIKLVYYPREEKLVSLDVMKLYRGEDVICLYSEDKHPDQWLDEGKLMELRDEIP